MLAPLVAGFVRPRWGFHPAFFLGAVGMIISLIVFGANQKSVRHAIEGRARVTIRRDRPHRGPAAEHRRRCEEAVPEWKRIVAPIVIFLVVIVFWMVFHRDSLRLT